MRYKQSTKKYPKFRFVLDAAFARPNVFEKLYKKSVLKHIRHDFNLSPQTEDEEIYKLAKKEKMFVVTMNYKDFKRLAKAGDSSGAISLDSGLSNEQIDKLLVEFIRGKNPEDYWGKVIKI